MNMQAPAMVASTGQSREDILCLCQNASVLDCTAVVNGDTPVQMWSRTLPVFLIPCISLHSLYQVTNAFNKVQ
jgi:hypothetical protein